jgi:UDP-N-acetylmuramoyl-tripeptide--D-alanyl-D-alanine ligase
MLELGPESREMHRETGMEIARLGIDVLWGVRGAAFEIIEGALAAGMNREATRYFESSEETAQALCDEIREGDLVLVKGSRGVRTDIVVSNLRDRFALVGADERLGADGN